MTGFLSAQPLDVCSESVPSGIQALQLEAEQLGALARNGFVSREWRGQRGPFYKLRFRVAGKQCVKYLGQDPQHAQQIRRELEAWQSARRFDRQRARAIKQARWQLRATKTQVQEVVTAAGFRFHGYALRRRTNKQNIAPR